MKLIPSNGHDYYDSAVGFGGIDPTCVYNRDSRTILIPHVGAWNAPQEFDIPNDKTSGGADFSMHTAFGILGFCGMLYPVIKVDITQDKHPDENLVFYTSEEYNDWYGRDEPKRKLRYYISYEYDDKYEGFFKAYAERKDDAPFIEANAPVFLIRNYRNADAVPRDFRGVVLETNPKLADLQFYRMRDAFAAFQDISFYLGNTLVKEKNVPVEISDKDKLTQHGFDDKSFKHPTRLSKL